MQHRSEHRRSEHWLGVIDRAVPLAAYVTSNPARDAVSEGVARERKYP